MEGVEAGWAAEGGPPGLIALFSALFESGMGPLRCALHPQEPSGDPLRISYFILTQLTGCRLAR